MILARFNGRHDNLGDKLIFSCLCEQLAKYDDLYILGEMSPSYANFAKGAFRFRHAFLRVAYLRLKGIRSKLFYPPGAHFAPRVSVDPGIVEKLQDKFILLLWRFVGCSIHITGISLGNEFDKAHYRRFKSVGVRDRESLEALSPFHNNVSLCPDMAFLRPVHSPKVEFSNAIISFRQDTPDDAYNSNYASELENGVKSIFEVFSSKEISAKFFANVEEDINFNQHLAETYCLEHADSVFLDRLPYDLDYTDFFSDYGVVVSNRLHVLLPAISEGLLPIALVSRRHYKIIRLFKTYNLERFIIYTECSSAQISEQISLILEKREELTQMNYVNVIQLRKDALHYLNHILCSY